MFVRFSTAMLTAVLALGSTVACAEDDGKRATPILPMGAGDDVFPVQNLAVRDSQDVEAVIAANPGRELVICLAGCKAGHASILWQRPLAVALVDGGGGPAILRSTRFDEAASVPSKLAMPGEGSADAIVCIAGCSGPVGLVVYRGMRLAWIRDDRKEHLAEALRRIADRLANADQSYADQQEPSAQPQRTWVGASAKADLAAAMNRSSMVVFDRVNGTRNEIKPRS